jgi:hypothetical protein
VSFPTETGETTRPEGNVHPPFQKKREEIRAEQRRRETEEAKREQFLKEMELEEAKQQDKEEERRRVEERRKEKDAEIQAEEEERRRDKERRLGEERAAKTLKEEKARLQQAEKDGKKRVKEEVRKAKEEAKRIEKEKKDIERKEKLEQQKAEREAQQKTNDGVRKGKECSKKTVSTPPPKLDDSRQVNRFPLISDISERDLCIQQLAKSSKHWHPLMDIMHDLYRTKGISTEDPEPKRSNISGFFTFVDVERSAKLFASAFNNLNQANGIAPELGVGEECLGRAWNVMLLLKQAQNIPKARSLVGRVILGQEFERRLAYVPLRIY